MLKYTVAAASAAVSSRSLLRIIARAGRSLIRPCSTLYPNPGCIRAVRSARCLLRDRAFVHGQRNLPRSRSRPRLRLCLGGRNSQLDNMHSHRAGCASALVDQAVLNKTACHGPSLLSYYAFTICICIYIGRHRLPP